MKNSILEFHHGGPTPARSFLAKLCEGGRTIELVFDDNGKTIIIDNNNGGAPIELMDPSIDGEILRCFLENGRLKFYKTTTGAPWFPNKEKKKGYNPQFYTYD